jgi:hypothetical protein
MKRMVTWFAVLSMTLAASSLAWSQAPAAAKGTVKGIVRFVIKTGDPVPGMTITLDGPVKKEAKSDDKGEFEFKELPAGDYKLETKGIHRNKFRVGNATFSVTDKELPPLTILIK